jgi:hypothetical protein
MADKKSALRQAMLIDDIDEGPAGLPVRDDQ